MKRNISINRFTNVDLFEVAIGAAAGTVGLHSGINSGVTVTEEGAYQVPLLPLTEVAGDRRVDFIKIDVEGYEGQVLEGAWEIIVRDRPIIFEINSRRDIALVLYVPTNFPFRKTVILSEIS